LDAAGKKWKDFKANLKRQFFKGEITEENLRTKQGKRLNDDDWNFLKNHWSTQESAVSTTPSFACWLQPSLLLAACIDLSDIAISIIGSS